MCILFLVNILFLGLQLGWLQLRRDLVFESETFVQNVALNIRHIKYLLVWFALGNSRLCRMYYMVSTYLEKDLVMNLCTMKEGLGLSSFNNSLCQNTPAKLCGMRIKIEEHENRECFLLVVSMSGCKFVEWKGLKFHVCTMEIRKLTFLCTLCMHFNKTFLLYY